MKEKKHMKEKTKTFEKYLVLILLATLFMGVAFAKISNIGLSVAGTVNAQLQDGLFISNISKIDSNGVVTEEIKYYDGTLLSTSIELSTTSTSYITYEISIYNNSSEEYYFTGVTYNENAYDNTNTTYSLEGIEPYITTIGKKEEITFNITFEYKDGITVSNAQVLNSLLSFEFNNEFIEFTIGEETYTAPKGTTWEQYVESEYNTYGFSITDNKVYTASNKQLLYTDETNNIIGQKVKNTDIISETLQYIPMPEITLDKETITLEIEEGGTATDTLTATVDNEDLELTWKVEPEDSGITIEGEGNTKTITVSKAVENATITVSYGIVSATCGVTVTEKPSEPKIGDKVAYDEETGYTSSIDSSFGMKDMEWRILDIEEDGTIELISTQSTDSTITLEGEDGYLYGSDKIDTLCDDLYGNGIGANSARNLKIEDIDKIVGIETDEEKKALNSNYGTTKNGYTDNFYTYDLSNYTTPITSDGISMADILRFGDDKIFEISWLSSKVCNIYSSREICYSLYRLDYQPIIDDVDTLCYVFDGVLEEYALSCPVRPVVVLKPDVLLKKHNNVWQIILEPELTLDKETIELEIESGGTATETLTATLENAEGELTWTVSEDSGITIEGEGNTRTITVSKAVENATITVSYGELVTATCSIRVTEKEGILTVSKAQGKVLSTTDNTEVYDEYGNKVVVPAGFKITEDANNVTEGIVITDETNEFVWVPVGTIYTNAEKTESKTITLGRYSDFTKNDEGEYEPAQTAENYATQTIINDYYTEDTVDNHNEEYGNAIAKSIKEFCLNSIANSGYYLGRYEAGDLESTEANTARTFSTSDENTLVCKANQQVYNYVTQSQASSLSQNMYKDADTFTSDLINSYAWDTAIIFIQTFGGSEDYYNKNFSTSFANTGINNDKYCNIYDMSGNTREWSTETVNVDAIKQCAVCGGCFDRGSEGTIGLTGDRGSEMVNYDRLTSSFRPLLYLPLESNSAEPKLTLDKEGISLEIESGGTATETLTATLENAEGDLTWTSSDTSIAEISGSGTTATITAKAAGTATITVSYGEISATCNVTVTEKSQVSADEETTISATNIAEWTSGDGTESNPYLIESEENLAYLAYQVNSGNHYTGVYFKLEYPIRIADSWIPIGNNSQRYFDGYFNGNGNVISFLIDITSNYSYRGLFGHTGDNSKIEGLSISYTNYGFVSTEGDFKGGIVGYNRGTIENCDVCGNVIGKNNVGGIAGYNTGTIIMCTLSDSEVNGNSNVGGISGYNSGEITDCSVLNSMPTGDSNVGGISGYNTGEITACSVSSSMLTGDSNVGGISGYNSGNISGCYTEYPDVAGKNEGTIE